MRARAEVRWSVRLLREEQRESVFTVTENISPEGFFCYSNEAFEPGEFLECHILVPTHARCDSDAFLRLECLVQVARVERRSSNEVHGIGCQIKAYRVPGMYASQVD